MDRAPDKRIEQAKELYLQGKNWLRSRSSWICWRVWFGAGSTSINGMANVQEERKNKDRKPTVEEIEMVLENIEIHYDGA